MVEGPHGPMVATDGAPESTATPADPAATPGPGVPPDGATPSAAGPWATFDRWAHWLFVAQALVTGIVGLLVLAATATLPGVAGALLFGVALAQAALLYAVGAALARGWGWARATALWLLGIGAVVGIGGALVDLTRSTLTIPVGAIASLIVLARAPGRPPAILAADRRWVTAVVGAAIALAVLPAAATFLLLDRASPLAATEDDLQVEVVVACHGDPGVMPGSADATVTWRWLRRDLLVAQPDTVGLAWSAAADGAPSDDMLLAGSRALGDSITPGSFGASAAAVEQATAGRRAWSWVVGTGGNLPDGSATVVLEPAAVDPGARPAHGRLFVDGIYAHADRWNVTGSARCDW